SCDAGAQRSPALQPHNSPLCSAIERSRSLLSEQYPQNRRNANFVGRILEESEIPAERRHKRGGGASGAVESMANDDSGFPHVTFHSRSESTMLTERSRGCGDRGRRGVRRR